MKKKEIRDLNENDAREKLAEMKKELIKLNAQVSTGTALKNPGQIRKIKKTLAKLLNEIKARKNKMEGIKE